MHLHHQLLDFFRQRSKIRAFFHRTVKESIMQKLITLCRPRLA